MVSECLSVCAAPGPGQGREAEGNGSHSSSSSPQTRRTGIYNSPFHSQQTSITFCKLVSLFLLCVAAPPSLLHRPIVRCALS